VAYPGSTASRLSESAGGTLPLLAYLALAMTLMVADQRGGFASQARLKLSVLAEPVWWVAASPGRVAEGVGKLFSTLQELTAENQRLTRELQVSASRLHRLLAVAEENQRLRELLGGTRGYRLSAKLVGIIDIDLDPSRQRILLDAGSDGGVAVGQAMIDAGGVLGQVVEVTPRRATALLLTDPDHAIPVQVVRSGLRTIAFGTGRTDQLRLPNIPQSADIRVGDRLVTSGLDGTYPPGLAVAQVTGVERETGQMFARIECAPLGGVDRSETLLVLAPPVALPPRPEEPSEADPARKGGRAKARRGG